VKVQVVWFRAVFSEHANDKASVPGTVQQSLAATVQILNTLAEDEADTLGPIRRQGGNMTSPILTASGLLVRCVGGYRKPCWWSTAFHVRVAKRVTLTVTRLTGYSAAQTRHRNIPTIMQPCCFVWL
jgi:hypothetical protein